MIIKYIDNNHFVRLVVPMNEIQISNMRQMQQDMPTGNATLDVNALRSHLPMAGPTTPGVNQMENNQQRYI